LRAESKSLQSPEEITRLPSSRSRLAPFLLCIALLTSAPAFARPHAAQSAAAAAQLEALSGSYTNPAELDLPFSVYVQDGKLFVESDRLVPTPLEPVAPLVYNIDDTRGSLTFLVDATGSATGLIVSNAPGATWPRTGPPVHHVFHDYQRTEAMIPMRDGVKLHAVILKPSDIATPLPFLIQRTPYGSDGNTRDSFFASRPELARSGYIYVIEDIRGRYKSQGKFVMMRPFADHQPGPPRTGLGPWGGHRNPKATDESTDSYDTVAWLLTNVHGNNGRAGFVGTSYPGFLAMMAGIDPHPAVKAISPQAPMIDVWMGDDFFHNGAFRQGYGYDYVLSMETGKEQVSVDYGRDKDGNPRDGYDFFLHNGSFDADVRASGSRLLPTWKLFLEHPAYDSVWSSRAVERALNAVAVPTLSVGGYYDQEDMWGPQEEYAKLEPHDTQHDNFLVLGPWRHGSWSSTTRHLGSVQYGEPIGREFRAQIEAPFFAYYLKGEPGFNLQDTASFQTGSNTWQRYAHFPPASAEITRLHLLAGGALNLGGAAAVSATTSYVSDPANPVPYRHRPIQPTYSEGSQWYNWLTEDQRFVSDRKDVAVWKLPVTHDLTLTGEVLADIFASTTGSDNDLVVKLIDQYPSDDPDPSMRGYQLMTNAEIFRGRYLASFDRATPLRPGRVYEYKFSLHDVDHVFKAGHTVMVEVQSSWFPLYDRNPQTFVPNIMTARPQDFQPATITVYSGQGHDSSVEVPVVKPCVAPACN
jgi:putative CocE/NonD family hydrolase